MATEEEWPIVCATGPRPQHLDAQERGWIRDKLPKAARWLRDERGTRIGISGMALGVDLWWADAIIGAGLTLGAYVPCPQQPDRWKDPADRREWRRLLDLADPNVSRTFADEYHDGVLGERNGGMLRASDAVLCCVAAESAQGRHLERGLHGAQAAQAGPASRSRRRNGAARPAFVNAHNIKRGSIVTTVYFGARWDSPPLDGDVRQVPVPVGQVCSACREEIVEGDRGVVRVCVRMVDGEPVGSAEPVHTECDLRGVMGHQVGVCPCNGHGFDRAAGRLTLERLNKRRASQGMGPM